MWHTRAVLQECFTDELCMLGSSIVCICMLSAFEAGWWPQSKQVVGVDFLEMLCRSLIMCQSVLCICKSSVYW